MSASSMLQRSAASGGKDMICKLAAVGSNSGGGTKIDNRGAVGQQTSGGNSKQKGKIKTKINKRHTG